MMRIIGSIPAGVSVSCPMLVGFVCHVIFSSGLSNWMQRGGCGEVGKSND